MASGRILWQVTGKNIFEEIYGKCQDTMASVRKKIFEMKFGNWQDTMACDREKNI